MSRLRVFAFSAPWFCILASLVALAACASSDSGGKSEVGKEFPYLTAQPAVTPASGSWAALTPFDYTVYATGPVGLAAVNAYLVDIDTGKVDSLAFADLVEGPADTWTGSAALAGGTGSYIVGQHYVHIHLSVDVASLYGTDYSMDFEGQNLTSYFFDWTDASGNSAGDGKSKYDLVLVDIQ